LKESRYVAEEEEDQIEVVVTLVTREIRSKKTADVDALKKVLELAKKIEVPASSMAREDVGVSAQQVIKAAEEAQEFVTTEAGSLLILVYARVEESSGAGELVKVTEGVQKEAGCSEADVSEAEIGNIDSLHTANIIDIESSTTLDSLSTPASLSTSTSTSLDMDDIPLNRIYENLQNSLSPSSSTKHQKKPDDDTFVHMYPFVEERIHDMQQRRINACVRLPADYPPQPPMIEPLQSIPADVEVVGDQTGPKSANHEVSVSLPKPTTQTFEPSVLDNLVNHYSRELPGYETSLEKASELASDEVISECPQQTYKWPH